jgi:hypothetical protein
MVVSLLYRGLRIAGLHIGQQNAKRFFPAGSTAVELQLDHLTILCPLNPRFWDEHPEILDARLCGWLESKFHHRGSDTASPHLTLVPSGPGAFQLRSLTMPPAPHTGKSLPPQSVSL